MHYGRLYFIVLGSVVGDIENICFFRERSKFISSSGNIFTSGAAPSENITDCVHEMK